MFRLILFQFTYLRSHLQWNWICQLQHSLKYFTILWPMNNGVRFEYVPWKMSDYVSYPLFRFTLVIKLRNFDFESHWNTLNFLDQKRWFRFWLCPVWQCPIWFKLHCLNRILAVNWEIRILIVILLFFNLIFFGLQYDPKPCLSNFKPFPE